MKFDLSQIKLSINDVKRGLVLPKESSKELAEFVGILTGDGYVNYYPYQYKYLLEIAGDSRLDKDYLTKYTRNLVYKLFNLESSYSYKKGQNTMNLRLISKGLVNFLLKVGFKKGRKEQIGIPQWILENNRYIIAFIKGLADTDFSIYYRKKYPIISMASKSEKLIRTLFTYLKDNNFMLTNYYKENKIDKRGYNDSIVYKIVLNGHNNFRKWMKTIGFRNTRHIKKVVEMGPVEFESTK